MITARNAGNVTVTNVVATDPRAEAGSITCAPTTLAPGETTLCRASHTVTQADLDAGQITNIATAEATEPDGTVINDPSNEVIVRATVSPAITVAKSTATAQVAHLGETVEYSIVVTNLGVRKARMLSRQCTQGLEFTALHRSRGANC